MKKLLIASAALAMVAGTAQAQSSVTVYGLLDIGYSNAENQYTGTNGVSNTVKSKNTGNGDGGLATSRLGFRGTEDLGQGRKANFQLEYDLVDVGLGGTGQCAPSKLLADTKTTTSAGGTSGVDAGCKGTDQSFGLGARYAWAGLSDAKLGELRLGRQEQSIHSVVVGGSAGAANNSIGALYSGGLNSYVNDAGVRPHNVFLNRAITYISPSFNGVRAELQTASFEVTDGTTTTSAKENGGSLKYAAGKLTVAYAIASTTIDTNTASTDSKVKQEAIAATYDLGVARVFALNTQNKGSKTSDGSLLVETKVTEIGVQVPVGKTTLWASTYDGDRKGATDSAVNLSSSVISLTNRPGDVKGYQVGARHDLSKRTALYAIYGQQEVKLVGAAAGAKVEATGFAAGVRHSF